MKRIILSVVFGIFAVSVNAKEEFNAEQFARDYFVAFVATQRPDAKKEDIERYLTFLADDFGYQHIPYNTDDSRSPEGKKRMRKGMTYYLANHEEYEAELINVFTFGNNAVAFRYTSRGSGVHPDNGKRHSYDKTNLEILEIENGKVAVIRIYDEE